MERNTKSAIDCGAAGVKATCTRRPQQKILKRLSPEMDMAHQEGERDAKFLHPSNLVVMQNAALFDSAPKLVSAAASEHLLECIKDSVDCPVTGDV